jgi:type IV pilus assembly protein PilV
MRLSPVRIAAGFAMVESMVTIVVVAFGLLGVAGLVSRSFVTEVEATQRTQAMMLVQDIITRIEANRANVAQYVTGDAGVTGYHDVAGTPTPVVCDPAAVLAERDTCEWSRLLGGANEQIDGNNASVLVGAIGCIYEIDAFNRIYAVSVAWQGMSDGAAPLMDPNFPPSGCGFGLFGDENRRRLVTMPLRLGTLGP